MGVDKILVRNGLILRVENKEFSNVVMKVGNKSGVTEEPVRESRGFNGVFVCGVFIDDGIVIDENAIFLLMKVGESMWGVE